MTRQFAVGLGMAAGFVLCAASFTVAQSPPYDQFPDAKPPYYRVRFQPSNEPGELVYGVNYTIWIPSEVERLRGVIVHQHGCGEGSCKSGLTGAFDLHWQALAKKHDCALLSPAYEQPEGADCQMWCDPRNGSAKAFLTGLEALGKQSGHPELAEIPWALWGHSGGGHWAGGMALLYPDRVVAAWLRSGVPQLKSHENRPNIKAHTLTDEALTVPLMCNLGVNEGVASQEGRFSGVWPANQEFFAVVRSKGGLVGVAIDPITSHECGNQRYLAIPWLDACLTARLAKDGSLVLRPMSAESAWLIPELTGAVAVPTSEYQGDVNAAGWLPSAQIARLWKQYVTDTKVTDETPPPAPVGVRVEGNLLIWEAEADWESGLAKFIVLRDGEQIAIIPSEGKNPFGRPLFQNLQYSDTPTFPLVPMQFVTDENADNFNHEYRIIAVNTAGISSQPSEAAKAIK